MSRFPVRAGRLTALSLLVALLMSAAAPAPGAIPPGEFPLPSLATLRGVTAGTVSSLARALPKQPGGENPRSLAQVAAKQTTARGGAGRKPGSAPGALPAESSAAAKIAQRKTPPIGGGKFDPKTSKRVAKDADRTSDVYRNKDGSFTRKVYEKPVNFKAADGSWQPIDPKLVSGNGRLRQKANDVAVSFAPKADDESC